jgi:hypothetical protein
MGGRITAAFIDASAFGFVAFVEMTLARADRLNAAS